MSSREHKIISYAWFALTLLYLFLRYQNIPGVFSDVGIITIDTDPYYRLHRIRSIVQGDWRYPLLDPYLNYPKGFWVSWPLGLDYLIAIPLKIFGVRDHASILIFSFLAMPIITFPILFLVGAIATRLSKSAWVGIAAGLFVTLINVLLQQTSVGRLDHHGLECLFLLAFFWFFLSLNEKTSKRTEYLIAGIMGLAPALYPHAWIPTLCFGLCLVFSNTIELRRSSRILFVAFFISLIPLIFSDLFWMGLVRITGYSWWGSLVLISMALWAQVLLAFKTKKFEFSKDFYSMAFVFGCVMGFLLWKQGANFMGKQIHEGVSLMQNKTSTLSVTSELKSPFVFDWDFLGEKILLWMMPLIYIWFAWRKKYFPLMVFSLVPLVLSYLQVRFMVPASGMMAILFVLCFWDLLQTVPAKKYAREALLFGLVMLVSSLYMPHLGMTQFTADSPYFQPIQHASILLKDQVQKKHEDPKQTAILASWDYGHWILFYSGLPVAASPFQGKNAVKSYEIFASESLKELEDFERQVPVKYMIVEQFPGRFYNVLEYAGKNPEDYFDFVKNPDGTYQKMSPKPSFDKVLFQRFLKNYGSDDDGNLPAHWRLAYVSPYPAQFTKNAPALKVFEHVPGAVIRTQSKEKELWLQISVSEKGHAKTLKVKSIQAEPGILQWTVPYSNYNDGDVACDGIYRMIDKRGKVLGVLPPITQDHVLHGEILFVR
ncbi:MAG: STT3 domain-containing protein [Bdellovibrionota bacterium]